MPCPEPAVESTSPSEATHALLAKEARSLVELAPDGIFVADGAGRCTYVNAAGARMLARRKEDIVGQPMATLLRPGEAKLLRQDGTEVDAEITATGAGGGRTHFVVRPPARAARDNERLMDAVFELMPTGVRIADAQGTVIRTNRAARDLWRGHPDGPAAGEMKAWWVRNGQALEHQDWPARRAARGEKVANELVRIQCFDGSFRTVMKCAAPLVDEAGRITGAVVVDEDVTALYEAKEKLEAGERLFRTVFELLPVGVPTATAG